MGRFGRKNLAGGRGASKLVARCLALALFTLACVPSAAWAALEDHTVSGVSPQGTTINLFDYWTDAQNSPDNGNVADYQKIGINKDHALKFGTGMGEDSSETTNDSNLNKWTKSARPRFGIVADTLGADGYPLLNNDNVGSSQSLAYLFDATPLEGKQAYLGTQGLLQIDKAGYYYYNSQVNFAEFKSQSNAFTLYDTWGVMAGGASPAGQFFPFNTASQVLEEQGDKLVQKTLDSTNRVINHYFGMTMSTRFVQRWGGHTDDTKRTAVTYNFSGDDDVWIFIDDVLVADLGGIHDKSSVEINFATGCVVVYEDANNNNVFDSSTDREYANKTLKEIFAAVGKATGFTGNTFVDNSYHTLNFFYLERGNTDSNMSLKYNLVTTPETDIQKIDQTGTALSGVTFQVYDYTGDNQGGFICEVTTDINGSVVLTDNTGFPITLEELYDSKNVRKLKLVESNPKPGYRDSGNIILDLQKKTGPAGKLESTVATSSNYWETGVYALPKVLTSAADKVVVDGEALTDEQIESGTMFVVIEKKVGNEWRPVYGDPINGWTVLAGDSEENILEAAKSTGSVFRLASSGAYETTIDDLPGDILDYVFFDGEDDSDDDGQLYRGVYYYTKAESLDDANAGNTSVIDNSNEFARQFSVRLYIPNIMNRFIVQKLSPEGEPLDGATFALYDENSAVQVDGEWVLDSDPTMVGESKETRTLHRNPDQIDLEGAAIFDKLEPGAYWLHEESAPKGYLTNTALTKIIVDDSGVYADAGVEGDGIEVSRGVGRLVKSMRQFAVNDQVDSSLHDITAMPYLAKSVNGTTITWNEEAAAEKPLSLHFSDKTDTVLDYVADAGSEQYYTTDTGVATLKI